MARRYVLGPRTHLLAAVAAVLPTDRKVLEPTIPHVDETAARLDYPPHDPAVVDVPAETRVYFVRIGEPIPATADEFVASPLPCGVSTEPIAPDGNGAYVVPTPTDQLAKGVDYFVQVVLGYDVPEPAPAA